VDAALYLVTASKRPILSLVTTNSTFAESAFQGVLDRLQVRTVLIGDEVHNLGARTLQTCLPQRVRLRLGLSATPERWMDEDGTQAIRDYFGEVVFGLDLEQAIRLEPPVLAPYSYHPVLVELADDEREEYLRLTQLLARYIESPRLENLSDVALALLLKRARLIACARNKLSALASAIRPYRTTRFNLVYCGDGRVEVESLSPRAADSVPEKGVLRQIEMVTNLLGQQMGMNVGVYTADTPDDDRQVLLREFEAGHKHALIAIRCLDEGVDIPQVRRAFILASSTNPRQFVQRRGRVLRRADGKESAEIFDFVVAPPLDGVSPGTAEYRVLRNLVAREMARVVEFARLATNGPQAQARLLPILAALRLMHL
jgi:superfamily II DNA or RNA helicase